MTEKNVANGSFEEAFLTAIVQYELGPLYAGISSFSVGLLALPKHLQNYKNKILLHLGKPSMLVLTSKLGRLSSSFHLTES